MKTAGIIAEYNPFHRGHGYHIRKTREITGADYIVAVMSGNFVQRGEPALIDKYSRTLMALKGGADLVLELPAVYAASSAELFASAGVRLLDQLGCTDYLSFGSEWADLSDYKPYVDLFTSESSDYRIVLKEYLREGLSFPAARSRAAGRILSLNRTGSHSGESADPFLTEPNHILGLEYLKALKRWQSDICPVVVKRQGSGYHDLSLEGEYPSASAVRNALKRMEVLPGHAVDETGNMQERGSSLEGIRRALGKNAGFFLNRYFDNEYVCWDDLMPLLDYEILMYCRKDAHKDAPESEKELMNHILKYYTFGCSFDKLMDFLHTKNRTDSSVRRKLIHILLHIGTRMQTETGFREKKKAEISVPYARVLGFQKTAAPLLKEIRNRSRIPLIQRPAEARSLWGDNSQESAVYLTDLLAADLYETVQARKCKRSMVMELTRQQVIVD